MVTSGIQVGKGEMGEGDMPQEERPWRVALSVREHDAARVKGVAAVPFTEEKMFFEFLAGRS